MHSRIPGALAVIATLTVGFFARGQVTITELGTFGNPNQTDSYGLALNSNGTVAVGSAETSGFADRAFRWSAAGGLQDLGSLGGPNSYANGVNADGSVVVGYAWTPNPFTDRAFRWTSAGMQDIGTLGGSEARAAGVSADGSVVVGWSLSTGDNQQFAFRWTGAGGMQSLGAIAPLTGSSAKGVSADGSVVTGDTGILAGATHAYRWTGGSGMQDIGSLGGDSHAMAVSGNGIAIVGYSRLATGTSTHAFRWTSAGMQDIGTLGTATSTYAEGVSPDGSVVVGGTDLTPNGGRAFLWTAGLGMVDLNTYLPSIGIDTTGWFFGSATAIDANGDIVGWGGHNGLGRGFLITNVPVPAPSGLAALAGVGLLAARRRRV